MPANLGGIARPYPPGILLDFVRQTAKEYAINVKLYGVDADRDKRRRTAVGIACREIVPNERERHSLYAWLEDAPEPLGLAQLDDEIVFGLHKLLGTQKDDLTGVWLRNPAAATELTAAAKHAARLYGQLDLLSVAAELGGVVSEQPADDPLADIDW
jgi:hypothetical protein